MNNIITIGLGLIGGSFNIDLKKIFPDASFGGIDKSQDHVRAALELKLIDFESRIEELNKADLVVIATPVDHISDILSECLEQINENCLVIDMGSIKSKICTTIALHPKRRNFLACHPIAGTEFSGPSAAHQGLFE